MVVFGIEVIADAERRTDLILAAVALADGTAVIVIALKFLRQLRIEVLRGLRELLRKGQNGNLDGRERRMEMHHVAHASVLERLLIIRLADKGKRHAVAAKRRLNDVRDIPLLRILVKVGEILSREFLVLGQIIIRAVRNAPQLAPVREGERVFNVRRRLGIERELLLRVVAEAQMLRLQAQRRQPLHGVILPVLKPLQIRIRLAEEFHLHLFEFTGAEREIAGSDLVAERLSDLADAKRQMPARRSLHIFEIDENALCRLGTQIDRVGRVLRHTLERFEHQVELTDIGPVELAARGAGNLEFVDEAHHLVIGPAVDGAIQGQVIGGCVILDEIVRAETLAAALAVEERIREALEVS